jgi:L-aminopeptidase/D-esterase-like protein
MLPYQTRQASLSALAARGSRHRGSRNQVRFMSHISKEQVRTLPGIRVGHASDFRGLTGCTVILCPGGAVCGVDIRGSASGTRDLSPCEPGHLVEKVHAVFLTGGSAFGLDAAGGVMHYLERLRAGFAAGRVRIPIVPAAVIFDLGLGSSAARPDAGMALGACRNAIPHVVTGSVGAGTGATVGKLYGMAQAMKGGLGFASLAFSGGAMVQALAVVNAFGDVVEPETGAILAGARKSPRSGELANTEAQMLSGIRRKSFGATNTTLVVVMTTAALTKLQATKAAQMAQDGMARAIRPAHTRFDGDLIFVLSVGTKRADLTTVGAAAAQATALAIVNAVKTAKGFGGAPSYQDLRTSMT